VKSLQKQNKNKGMKFEKKIQRTIGSGMTWFSPLDLDCGRYCIECKFSEKKGFRIPLTLVEKIWNQALSLNKEPLLSIGIKRNDHEIFVLNCQIRLERK